MRLVCLLVVLALVVVWFGARALGAQGWHE